MSSITMLEPLSTAHITISFYFSSVEGALLMALDKFCFVCVIACIVGVSVILF